MLDGAARNAHLTGLTMRRTDTRTAKWTGMRWCRHALRHAIIFRNGQVPTCLYCLKRARPSQTDEGWNDGGRGAWQLDHIVPPSQGGSNGHNNVALACGHCNASKGDLLVDVYSEILSLRTGEPASAIQQRVLDYTLRPAPCRKQALRILKECGQSWTRSARFSMEACSA